MKVEKVDGMSNAFKFDDVVDDRYTDYHRSRQSLFLPYCHGKKQKRDWSKKKKELFLVIRKIGPRICAI